MKQENGTPPIQDQTQIFAVQIQEWADRVDFLREWNKALERWAPPDVDAVYKDNEWFELRNLIHKNNIEIEAKLNAIDKRNRDFGAAKISIEKQKADIQNDWSGVIIQLAQLKKNIKKLPVENQHLIMGILQKSKAANYRNTQQQWMDLELGKKLIASANRE